LKTLFIIFGIIIAAAGGALAYHALFVEPPKADLVSSTGNVRELPNLLHLGGGLFMLVCGAGIAFYSTRRQSR
jgi:hypothetical protein